MAGGSDIDVRPDSMEGLATTLQLGMISLDGLAFTTPTLPNAGASTPEIAEGIATVADVLGTLTAAFGVAAEKVDATNRTNLAAEEAVTRSFSNIHPS